MVFITDMTIDPNDPHKTASPSITSLSASSTSATTPTSTAALESSLSSAISSAVSSAASTFEVSTTTSAPIYVATPSGVAAPTHGGNVTIPIPTVPSNLPVSGAGSLTAPALALLFGAFAVFAQ